MKTIKYLLIIVCLIFYFVTNGQIYYIDINPDANVCAASPNPNNSTYAKKNFDLNQDSIFDIGVYSSRWLSFQSPSSGYGEGYTTGIFALDTNSKIAFQEIGPENSFMPCTQVILDSGVVIDNHFEIWKTNVAVTHYELSGMWIGCYNPSTPKYYALKLYFNSNYYYGWVRVSAYTGTIVVYDMAINLIPNQSIVAGQTTVSISENNFKKEQLTIYPNPANGIFNIKYGFNKISDEKYEIYDNTGNIVKSSKLTEKDGIIQVDMHTSPSGIYFVRVISQDKVYTAKVALY
jgi:hypothetical protein